MLSETIFDGLNPQQKLAVETTEGPILVLAGAGSGKTRVLTHRIAHLIGGCGIPADSILAVTFTNKAAGEMRERVEKILGPVANGLWVSTFHSTCVRILRREIGQLGRSRSFVIYDDSDSLGVVKEVLRRHNLDPKAHDPRRLRWRIDQWKNAGLLPEQVIDQALDVDDELYAELYATYQRLLTEADALDFGDLLLLTVDLFRRFPEVLSHYQERWQYVLVDEYQDTNRVQYDLVRMLAAEHRNLCVVGDPDQCLPPTAPVMTPEGPRPIGELRDGDFVIAGAGQGGSRIAAIDKVMERHHCGELLRVVTEGGRTLEATPNHLCFGRVDAASGLHCITLVWQQQRGFRIDMNAGRSVEAVLEGCEGDLAWVLKLAPTREEAEAFAKEVAQAAELARVGQWGGDEASAAALLHGLGLDPRYPYARKHGVALTLFGADGGEHRVQRHGSEAEVCKLHDAAQQRADEAAAVHGGAVHPAAKLTDAAAFLLQPASHLQPGMRIPVLDGASVREDEILRVECTSYDGPVYDLSIPELRNFSAGGVLVHNSVYGWRGADIRNILDFEGDYDDAHVVKLEQNYRSTQPILSGATAVVENNLGRKDKAMFTERDGGELIRCFEAADDREEAQFVVQELLKKSRDEEGEGRALSDFAILYRTNAQSRPFEEELLKYDLPYVVVGGVRFYDRLEIKDAIAYLRLMVNPRDDMALRRILNKPARGIGKTTLDRAAAIGHRDGISLLEALGRGASSGELGRSASKVGAFVAMLDQLRIELADTRVDDAIATLLDRSGYLRALEKEETPEAEARVDNLKELLTSAQDFHGANAGLIDEDRSEVDLYLDQIALVSDTDQIDRGAESVSLLTAHSAKGLEYPCVFIVGMEEGIFPHASSARSEDGLEEERRLCYVAMTRAMEELTITCASERLRFGERSYQSPSRFLREIPETLVEVHRSPRGGRRGDGSYDDFDQSVDYTYAQEQPGEAGAWQGQRVRHAVFGVGTIIEVEGEGLDAKLKIKFDKAGVKKVMVRYANLEAI